MCGRLWRGLVTNRHEKKVTHDGYVRWTTICLSMCLCSNYVVFDIKKDYVLIYMTYLGQVLKIVMILAS